MDPVIITQIGFSFLIPKVNPNDIANKTNACQLTKVSRPISNITPPITATAAIFTLSRKLLSNGDFLIFETKGFRIKVNIKEGKKIPAVAAIAPQKPVN